MPDEQPDMNGISTVDTPLDFGIDMMETPKKDDRSDDPPPEDRDLPMYKFPGSTQDRRLVKNEDKEVVDRYPGATYEVRQFSLWKDDDCKDYQDIMSGVGTDKYSRIVFQDRVWVEEKQSWKVLIEIEHFVLVAR